MSSCVCWVVRRAARILTRIYDEALAPAGLTSMQLGTLDSLSDLGEATLTRLAEETGHERSATWRGLQPLIAKGYVVRADPSGRADRYRISPEGKAKLDEAMVLWRTVQGNVLATLGDDAARLTAMVDKLDALDRTPASAA
jgi:DNA-binding MarR family transcriptional regulator